MEVRPIPGGVKLFGFYLGAAGLIPALALGILVPWAGGLFWLAWLGITYLAARFGMATIRVQVTTRQLVAQGGTIFPWEVSLPLEEGVGYHLISTPLMRVMGCCLLQVTTPGGGILLPALARLDAQALVRLAGRREG